MISATGSDMAASYAYDAQGRRKSKTVNGTSTIFVTDASNREVLEYNGSGAIANWYAYALGPNDTLNQMNVASATRATLIPDVQGSFVGSLDASSGTLTKTGYQSYGESALPNSSFAYTGQRIDPETGLYYYRARMYSPALGRFPQTDPIGYVGGSNLYRYVANDPLSLADPYGFAADSPETEAAEPENANDNLIQVAQVGPATGISSEEEEFQAEEAEALGGGGRTASTGFRPRPIPAAARKF
ncbi:MAG: RHS repeat-associated core domain-containing protein [Xanthobacteraceae bacterium]